MLFLYNRYKTIIVVLSYYFTSHKVGMGLMVNNLDVFMRCKCSYRFCGTIAALSVQLYKNNKILTHTSLIIQEGDNIFSSLSFSHSVCQEGTLSSAAGQPFSQSVRWSYMLSASALLVDIWLSSYIFHLSFRRFMIIM